MQTDGYAGYDEVGHTPGVTHVGCLAHVRRTFFDAEKQGSTEASQALSQIAELYHAERRLRSRYEQGELTTEELVSLRAQEQGVRLSAMKAGLMEK